MSRTSEYHIWSGIKQRCLDPKHQAYAIYGGAGVKICQRWLASFLDFYNDMGPRPSKEHSLDRFPNNDGDYEPGNVRWATKIEQVRNRRNTVYIVHNGENIKVCELGPLALNRFRLGWPYENIISGIPPKPRPCSPHLEQLPERPSDIRAFCHAKRKEGLKLRQIGELLGVSRQRAEQLLNLP